MGSSDITTAMDFNCRLMEVQIQLAERLTALQVSNHFWCPKLAGVVVKTPVLAAVDGVWRTRC